MATAAFMSAFGLPAVAGAATTGQPVAAAAPAVSRVTLVTGDVVETEGQQSRIQAVNSGPGALFTTYTQGADRFVVPTSAMPYLGSTLDPSLFDVTKLAQQPGGQIYVTMAYRPGSHPSAVPGIATTGPGTGVLTGASERAFGTALTDEWRASGGLARTSGPLAGVARIALAGTDTPVAPAVQPDYDMRTLTLNVIDPPAFNGQGGDVSLMNVDSLRRYNSFTGVYGTVKISVPAGHYAVMGEWAGADNDVAAGMAEWAVSIPQFDVAGDTRVTLDGRTATHELTVGTPRKATSIGNSFATIRTDALGIQSGLASANDTGHDVPLFLAPTQAKVTVGKFAYGIQDRLTSPAGFSHPYTYDLDFAGTGQIPAAQDYRVTRSNLATIHQTFGSAGAVDECPSAYPAGGGAAPLQPCYGFTSPTSNDEYVTAQRGLVWGDHAEGYGTFIPGTSVVYATRDVSDKGWQAFSPGEIRTRDWFGQPDAPTGLSENIFAATTVCSACRTGNTLDLSLYPRGNDSVYGYLDAGTAETSSYSVYADGALVQQAAGSPSGDVQAHVALPGAARDYRIDYDVNRDPTLYPLSSSTRTEWRVAARAARRLPSGWECDLASTATNCSVLPLITVSYHLPANASGRLVRGTVTLGRVGRPTGADPTAARVQVSFNGGGTWADARLTRDRFGTFGVAFTVPAGATKGDLRISAAGRDGSTLSQTVTNAFAVAP
jgi:hypothetical protein